jgi:hypothetical protein
MVSKAKAAKLVRALVDQFLDMEASTGKEVYFLYNKDNLFVTKLLFY